MNLLIKTTDPGVDYTKNHHSSPTIKLTEGTSDRRTFKEQLSAENPDTFGRP